MRNDSFRIAVMPGDGIGHEVIEACLPVLNAVTAKTGGFKLDFETWQVGAQAYQDTGTDLSDEARRAAGEADAILFGSAGLPHIRRPDGRELAPQLDLREELQLFAGVRPVRVLPGAPTPLADPRARDVDLVVLREQTEGMFATRERDGVEGDKIARDEMVITRDGSERLFDFAFSLARRRKEKGGKGMVTCVDKANVLTSLAFFRKIFDERAAANSDIDANHAYVDAMAYFLVRDPWSFDVLVSENLLGDIISDLTAALVGGLGMAPSADIGPEHGLFQPAHGSAPDIAGQGKANPIAMFLSAAMMLDWLGGRHDVQAACDAAALLDDAIARAFAGGDLRPTDLGGTDGLKTITERVLAEIAAGG
ncbi:MAG: isocitrate/isopropylmalate dehydrogenase family protein [Rhodospirillaceae bacterium]|nr:isocitrate/isopropylmalate dehydrogenase family protein [Rhodospirillaceae bacterium]